MKKILRIFVVLFACCMIFSGCGESTVIGTYAFRMGKNESAHIAIYMQLTDEDSLDDDGAIRGRKFTLTLDAPIEELTGELSDGNSDGTEFKLEGFYTLEESGKDGQRIQLGIVVFEDITIPPDLVSVLLTAYAKDGGVEVRMPVSAQDFGLQIYWYENAEKLQSYNREEDGEVIGSHPKQKHIDEINETYPAQHEGAKYRDFHSLTMKLMKV